MFLAIDPSMQSCGWALADPEQRIEDFIHESGRIAPPPHSDAHRIGVVAKQVARIVRQYEVEFIVVETPTTLFVKRGRSLDALKVLLPIGAVMGIGPVLGIPVYPTTVRDWKGAGTHYKEHSVELVNRLWPGRAVTDDEAEATLLALSVVQGDEVRAAIGLMKSQVPIERCLGVLRNEWPFGEQELRRIEKLALQQKLSGVAGSRKGRPPQRRT